jgi:glutamyl-tRNA synthetase
VQELRDAGFLPEAVINYLSLLGWGAADDETILSRDEVVAQFTLERVSKNPARFDEKKLRWMNGLYIRGLGFDELTARLETFTGRTGLRDAVAISQEKIATLADFWPLAGPIFDGPVDDAKAREQWLGEEQRATLAQVRTVLAELEPFDLETIDAALRGLVESLGAKPKQVFQPIRVALIGTTVSPGVFEIIELLGREETLRRLDAVL